MHSTYALIFASRSDLNGLRTAEDLLKLPREKLDTLRIGVFTKSPGSDWPAQERAGGPRGQLQPSKRRRGGVPGAHHRAGS